MKNKIYIYNTLSKKKEEFNSLTKDYVVMPGQQLHLILYLDIYKIVITKLGM